MAARKHKARKSSITKEAVDDDKRRRPRWPWSELPPTNPSSIHPRINLETNLWLNNRSNAAGITKSWLPTTTRCNNNAHQRPQLYHVITDSSKNPNPIPTTVFDRRMNHFLGDSSTVEDVYDIPDASKYWCLLKSDTTARTHPPPTIPSNRFSQHGPQLQLSGILGTNGPTSGLTVNYIVYRDTFWYKEISIRHECTTPDPFDAKKKLMEFGSIVHCEGKFYATSLQGTLAVMQVNDTRLKITAMSAIRAVPSVSSRFFMEYLVEMKGEILLVFLIHQKSLAVVDHVEVFRLDFGKLRWIKVERLQGKTMFLKGSCIWVDSAEFGCRDDCVYFTQGSDNSLCVYDMKTCCISPVLLENWTSIS